MQTGYFRDQKRRIDIVIVVDDTFDSSIEYIKEIFFRNCMHSGLEFELEPAIVSFYYLYLYLLISMFYSETEY